MLKKKEMMGGFDEKTYLIKVVDQQYVDENKAAYFAVIPLAGLFIVKNLGLMKTESLWVTIV